MSADLFSEWRSELKTLETCPWAGPRPLREGTDDSWQLVGRDEDVKTFLDYVLRNKLVILEADSGVGKSSLLNAGLNPALREHGYLPLHCFEWAAQPSTRSDVDGFFASAFAATIEPVAGESFAETLHQDFGADAVVVLDQFEELLRHDEALYAEVLDWIVDAVKQYDFKVVICLRSEYSHRLRELERRLGPFVDVARFVLEPIADESHVSELLRAPTEKGGSVIRLDEETTKRILEAWSIHDLGSKPTGLLQLHSLLYALHGSCPSGTTTIGFEAIDLEAAKRLGFDPTVPIAAGDDVFLQAMSKTVDLKMDHCEQALVKALERTPQGGDPALQFGTRGAARRLVSHLSSGGFKLVRELWDLAERTLDREFAELVDEGSGSVRESPVPPYALFERLSAMVDLADPPLLSSGWNELVAPEHWGELFRDGQPWDLDPKELTSGPMLSMHPGLVLLEEFRRFVFAVKWLEACNLIRMTKTSDGRSMVALVHDGFGAALEAWADSVPESHDEAVSRLTATRGARFIWRGKEISDQEIVNARWRECVIEAAFRRVVFVNCDFRGSRFEECTFEGVVFLNCLLDAVTISDSKVVGAVGPYNEPYPKGVPPSYTVLPSTPTVVHTLARYRGLSGGANKSTRLVSHTSGLPAVPLTSDQERVLDSEGTAEDGKPARIEWRREPGGIAMYGGRLCSLMIRRCSFVGDGTVALRQVSGTALDLVECTGTTAHLSVFGSTIRGLTVTLGGSDASTGTILIDAFDTVMAETWLGPNLDGRISLTEGLIWQLVNLSDDVKTDFADCGYFGLVNVSRPNGNDLSAQFRIDGVGDLEAVVELSGSMDYQSNPALREYERRRATTPDLLWAPFHGPLG